MISVATFLIHCTGSILCDEDKSYDFQDMRELAYRLDRIDTKADKTQEQLGIINSLLTLAQKMENYDIEMQNKLKLKAEIDDLEAKIAAANARKVEIENKINDKNVAGRFKEIKKLSDQLGRKNEDISKAQNELKNLKIMKDQEKRLLDQELEDCKNEQIEIGLNIKYCKDKIELFNKSYESISLSMKNLDSQGINRSVLIDKTMELEDVKNKVFRAIAECFSCEQVVEQCQLNMKKIKEQTSNLILKLTELKKSSEKYLEAKEKFDCANRMTKNLEEIKTQFDSIKTFEKSILELESLIDQKRNEIDKIQKRLKESTIKKKELELESVKKEVEALPQALRHLRLHSELKAEELIEMQQIANTIKSEGESASKTSKRLSAFLNTIVVITAALIGSLVITHRLQRRQIN